MSATDSASTRTVHFKVITTAPEYTVRVGHNILLSFDDNGEAKLELPIGSDWIVYYDLLKTEIGQTFELHMSERGSAVKHTVETNSQSVFGFAGLDVLP